MFDRDVTNLSIGELRGYVAQLTETEADVRSRVESRKQRPASAAGVARDLVAERLTWVLVRLGAQRQAAAAQLARLGKHCFAA